MLLPAPFVRTASAAPRSAWHLARSVWSGAAGRTVWALGDQGVVSLGNFLTHLVLARQLAPAEYGTFAVILESVLYCSNLHASAITYPLSFHGATTEGKELGRLTTASLVLTALLALVFGLIATGLLNAFGLLSLSPAVVALLLAWLFQETLRRSLLAHLRHREATVGDAVSYLGQAALLLALSDHLSLELTFGLMATTSTLAFLIQTRQVKLARASVRDVLDTARQFRRLASWSVVSTLTSALTVQAFPWTLAGFHGAAALGGYQALANLAKVINPIIISVSNLIVPAVARARGEGTRSPGKTGLLYSAQGAVLIVPYLLAIVVWPEAVLHLLYGEDSPYLVLGLPLRVFALGYALTYVAEMLAAVLKGHGESRLLFYGYVVNSVAAVCIGLPMVAVGGVMGATVGGFLSVLPRAVLTAYMLRARGKRN